MDTAPTSPRMSWTQPICERDFLHRHPDKQPARVIHSDREICVDCGGVTWVGIYIRIDPATALFPSRIRAE